MLPTVRVDFNSLLLIHLGTLPLSADQFSIATVHTTPGTGMQYKPLSDIRHDNSRFDLSTADAQSDPIMLMEKWLRRAIDEGYYQPNAMSLASVDASGQPTSRIVLLKDLSDEGLFFYTNYQSRKGQDFEHNPRACALFYWDVLERQIRIEGNIEKLTTKQSDHYFASRPRESQMGAIASPQSQGIPDRKWLDQRFQEVRQRYQTQGEIQRPPFWGGYVLKPTMIEFWQGRPSRLHDRLCYQRQTSGEWKLSRLAP